MSAGDLRRMRSTVAGSRLWRRSTRPGPPTGRVDARPGRSAGSTTKSPVASARRLHGSCCATVRRRRTHRRRCAPARSVRPDPSPGRTGCRGSRRLGHICRSRERTSNASASVAPNSSRVRGAFSPASRALVQGGGMTDPFVALLAVTAWLAGAVGRCRGGECRTSRPQGGPAPSPGRHRGPGCARPGSTTTRPSWHTPGARRRRAR